jgi:hypothetical protein
LDSYVVTALDSYRVTAGRGVEVMAMRLKSIFVFASLKG